MPKTFILRLELIEIWTESENVKRFSKKLSDYIQIETKKNLHAPNEKKTIFSMSQK